MMEFDHRPFVYHNIPTGELKLLKINSIANQITESSRNVTHEKINIFIWELDNNKFVN